MKIKKIRIKGLQSMLDDVVITAEAIERGERLKPVRGAEVYFTSFEAVRKVLTPKRLELLHIIKTQNPTSISELARLAKRDVKNVADDVKYLAEVGLIDKKETAKQTSLSVSYDRLAFEMAV